LYKSFEEATEQFRELFESACTLRMRSDVPVGSALSGGIDSGFVVSTLGKLGFGEAGGYTALVASFPGSYLDETKDALQVATNAGVDAVKVTIQPDLDPEHILKAIYDFEELYLTAPLTFFQSYKGFREKGIVVTLDGHGGDELFGGYPFDLDAKLKDDFPNLWKMRDTLSMINRMYGKDADAEMGDSWVQFKTELVRRKRAKGIASVLNKEDHYRNKLFHSTFQGILPTLLRNYDHYSMHAGVEVRMPFLDYRIIAFAFSLPNEYKVRNGFSKAIVREAAKPIVPANILKNKVKTGWNSPMGEWLSVSWKQWILDEVNSSNFSNCDLIDVAAVKQRLHRFYDEARFDHTNAQQLWLQLQPYFLEKANKQFA
jgi:asparagine synthase (glutamine-hydrolysing)